MGFARLKPQVTLEQARAELNVLHRQYAAAHPGRGVSDASASMQVVWMRDQLVANVRPMLWMLFGAVGFVLLIACANVASLLLARAASRSREFAVRAALGAGRGRLIRQLLAESLALSAMGGALGVLLAQWGLHAITRVAALPLPRAGEIRVDGTVLGFTVALSMATGVLFGLFPSLAMSRPDLADVLRETGAAAGRGLSSRRSLFGVSARGLLVVVQVALSIVLLIGAALLMQSFARLHSVDPGFQPANLLTMKIALPTARYDADQKRAAFFAELVRRVEAVPGVRAVSVVLKLPTTTRLGTDIHIAGRPDSDGEQSVQGQSITPGYLRTLGIALRRGRAFTARDNAAGSPPVVMINEGLARRFWPDYPRGQDPVGQRISTGYDKAIGWMEIVGIMADVRDLGLAEDAEPTVYLPTAVHPPQVAYLAARTEGDPRRFVNTIRSQALAIDSDQPVSDIRTMDEVIEASVGQRRLTMLLLGVFAGIALLLAMVGIYGVIAYSVAQRTQEVGIRRALGARPGDILRLVLGQALGLTLAGVALGIGGALAVNGVMKGLLFKVSATDPVTYAGIALLFVAVALAASYIPARRATRIDPMAALRVG
jgi:predicted permease